ncbi:MAG TPA: helix-turn-helix domain-containing protein [Streptosporangiaceae bacterium]
MPGPADIPIGERIRFYRQAHRKTQVVVAGLAGVTEDYLSQIERGLKTPSTTVLHRLARVLGVPTSALFGESSAEPATSGHPLSAAIHTALATGGRNASTENPTDLLALRDRVNAAWKSWQTAPRRYSQTGPLLPSLITDVQSTVRTLRASPDAAARREAAKLSADLYFLLRTFTKRIGRADLSLLVAHQGVRAAEDADDPLRIAAAKWNLGQVPHRDRPNRRPTPPADERPPRRKRPDYGNTYEVVSGHGRPRCHRVIHHPPSRLPAKTPCGGLPPPFPTSPPPQGGPEGEVGNGSGETASAGRRDGGKRA